MPRNNTSRRRTQQAKPWSGTASQELREHAGRGESRQIRRGRPRGNRRLSVRSELRQEPDVRRIARAVIELAMAQAETDAANETTQDPHSDSTPEVGR